MSNPTREEALEELNRRRSMSQPTREEALAEIQRRKNLSQPQNSEQSFGSKLPDNILNGLLRQRHNVINTPSDLGQLLQQRFKEFGSVMQRPQFKGLNPNANSGQMPDIAGMIPRESEKTLQNMLGDQSNLTTGDKFIQGGIEHAPELLGAFKLLKAAGGSAAASNIGQLFKKSNPENLVKHVQAKHDTLYNKATGLYDKVKNEAKAAGVNTIEVDKDLINEAKDFLPKSRKYKKLIESAESGDYESLHALQSDLGKISRKALSEDSYASNNVGHEIADLRDRINENTENFFEKKGYKSIAEDLREGRDEYRKLKETYYSNPNIAKTVEEGLRIEPKNPMNLFGEKSDRMRLFLSKHPELEEEMKIIEAKDKFKKKLKPLATGSKYAAGGTAGLGIIAGGKSLFDLLTGK